MKIVWQRAEPCLIVSQFEENLVSQSFGVSGIWIMVAAIALPTVGCSGDDGSSSGSQSGPAGTTSAGTSSAAGMIATAAGTSSTAGASGAAGMQGAAGMMADDGKPTWSGIYQYEFRSCRVEVCHGKGIAGVVMATKQGAYDSLVDQMSDATRPCGMLGKKRVVPGDPLNSLLYIKLDINVKCGQQMPPGGQLSDEARDRIRDWIMLGAKND
jgi:hypothetical protein